MGLKPSPFAPAILAELPPVEGVRLAAAEAGIKYKNRKDVLFVLMDEEHGLRGVLTQSRTASAPVEWCRRQLEHGQARALIVNSGNSNAFTGMRGHETVQATVAMAAAAAACSPEHVFVASTGVIGEPLNPGKFEGVLDRLAAEAQPGRFDEAARTIMTTDTYPKKAATRRAEVGGVEVTINGIAKGSGMIAPDMATMLSFLFTDAPIAADVLTALLREHVETTFNAITVDSDTSTSDTLLLFATGAAAKRGAPHIAFAHDPALAGFSMALHAVLHDLALQVIKDGEGISKLIEVTVEGAETDAAAKHIGMTIANSPLVKTAVAGEDPNWGRIVMAVGKSGEAANRDRLAIWFGETPVARDGMVHPDYREAQGADYMKGREIVIRVDAGTSGPGRFTVWGCDLTAAYVSINADYRS